VEANARRCIIWCDSLLGCNVQVTWIERRGKDVRLGYVLCSFQLLRHLIGRGHRTFGSQGGLPRAHSSRIVSKKRGLSHTFVGAAAAELALTQLL
jgi:hypothetical protein